MLSELVAAEIPPPSLVFFSTQQDLSLRVGSVGCSFYLLHGVSGWLQEVSVSATAAVLSDTASTGVLLSHVLRHCLCMKQKKEQKSSEEPSVYYFHPVSSLLNVSFSSRAEVIHVFCVSALQSVMLRLIATQSGLVFFIIFYIIVLKHVDYMRWMLGLEVSQACSWKVPSS